MPDTPALSFHGLGEADIELALSLAAAENTADADSESFGIDGIVSPPPGEGWGLWMAGVLAGAAWLRRAPGAEAAEVTALVLARGWRRLGLAAWMLGELARAAAGDGCREVVADIRAGGAGLAAVLSEAGFAGPDPGESGMISGKWSRKCL